MVPISALGLFRAHPIKLSERTGVCCCRFTLTSWCVCLPLQTRHRSKDSGCASTLMNRSLSLALLGWCERSRHAVHVRIPKMRPTHGGDSVAHSKCIYILVIHFVVCGHHPNPTGRVKQASRDPLLRLCVSSVQQHSEEHSAGQNE